MSPATIHPQFLTASYRSVVVGVQLKFQIPESVLRDFEDGARRSAGEAWGAQWRYSPILRALALGIPDKGEWGWDRPFNKPFHGPSPKGIIQRIKARAKSEPLIEVTEEIAESFWEKIQERAAFHGVSPGELCLSCIGYHASLEERTRERERPKNSFDSFERALAKEARQKPGIPAERPPANILSFVGLSHRQSDRKNKP